MFSDCSGSCCTCNCSSFCLAGHGDDDFCLASKETLIKRLFGTTYKNNETARKDILETLKTEYKMKDYEIIDFIEKSLSERYNSLVLDFNSFRIDMNKLSCDVGVKILTIDLTDNQKEELLDALKKLDNIRNEWFDNILDKLLHNDM